jgi:hypothetical protein
MKYVSMRSPEAGPLGETFFDARFFAIVVALLVNSPAGGCVESVLTLATHRLGDRAFLVWLAMVLLSGNSGFRLMQNRGCEALHFLAGP